MEVEKVSEACITPSSPTPSHLKTCNISLLDQLVPPFHIPLIIFYPNQETTIASNDFISTRSLLLKQSLSETLSRFYPLSGKIKNDVSIDCNDEGVYYVEARSNVSMSEYLTEPLSSIKKLFPEGEISVSLTATPGSHVARIQETTFACGGFTIALLVSHIICDGTALSCFLKDWANTTCQSNKEICYPCLDSPSIFPQYDLFSKEEVGVIALCGPFSKEMKLRTRRFVFNASAISNLKDKAISLGLKNPTRVELVSALLCKCLMETSKARSGKDKPLAITQAVNLRRRAEPQFPECSLGNFVWLAATLCTPKEAEFGSLVCQLREAIGKISGDFVKKLQGDGGYLKLHEMMKETRGEFGSLEVILSGGVDYVNITSWCNFGLYDIDFGWGKPVWTSSSSSALHSNVEIVAVNSIILMDAKKEKGIEAWVFLDEEDMLLLEKDKELLQCACVDPNP